MRPKVVVEVEDVWFGGSSVWITNVISSLASCIVLQESRASTASRTSEDQHQGPVSHLRFRNPKLTSSYANSCVVDFHK